MCGSMHCSSHSTIAFYHYYHYKHCCISLFVIKEIRNVSAFSFYLDRAYIIKRQYVVFFQVIIGKSANFILDEINKEERKEKEEVYGEV